MGTNGFPLIRRLIRTLFLGVSGIGGVPLDSHGKMLVGKRFLDRLWVSVTVNSGFEGLTLGVEVKKRE